MILSDLLIKLEDMAHNDPGLLSLEVRCGPGAMKGNIDILDEQGHSEETHEIFWPSLRWIPQVVYLS